jgi:hypothetical protein
MSKLVYLDSSAYLAVVLAQEGWAAIRKLTQGKRLASSVLFSLEVRRNIIRLHRESLISQSEADALRSRFDNDLPGILLRNVTPDLCGEYPFPSLRVPKSADLLHLRTALWLQSASRLEYFVTTDVAQRGAATELGLPVASV